jgi:ankyrin repeat protein
MIYFTVLVFQRNKTPLHIAAEKGSVECVRELMQHVNIAEALTMVDNVSNN